MVSGGGAVDQSKAYSEDKLKNLTCRGSFRLAQIAELLKQRAMGGRVSSRARKSKGNFLVHYSQELKQEEELLLMSALICYGVTPPSKTTIN